MTFATKPEPPDILSDEHNRDPHASYEVLRDYYPAYFHPVMGSWLVSRHADIEQILKGSDVSNESYSWQIEPVHGRTIINMEGREHSIHRRLLTPFFHRGGLESFKPAIKEVVRSLVDPVFERERTAVGNGSKLHGEVDLARDIMHQLPISVIEELLSLPKSDHSAFERWYGAIMDFIGNLVQDPDIASRGLEARKELTTYFLPLIAERRQSDGTDLLTLMCQADVDGDRLSDEEIRAFVSLMITAGGETTDRALGNMFLNLLNNQDQLEDVYADRSLIVDAFAETLRHTPPVHIAARQTLHDIEIGGITIPGNSTVTCLLAAGNRDPRKFSEPNRFDIHRLDNDTDAAFGAKADHLGFAAGRHFCVGSMLAKAEVVEGTNQILNHMKNPRFSEGFQPHEKGLFTRGVDSLMVTFDPA